ncbi:hypothetical protein E1B28_009211 [Marasmius oreades]|uniref:Uncharacterized protein n=1 Tax=Marasmius oreades TaxID=181124 RepID=A0A9P7S0M4_9AGAR|nr:uncharacterized protein E1B28_009211 [Marasmius oreades]KAG7092905.1 hypothetical protein E1B28_009211 [Marasmius oreades]
MSVSCTTTPTATSTVLVTTSFPTTDFLQSTITAEPTTSVIATSTTCLGFLTPSIGVPICTSSSTITELTTIPGGVFTTQIPVVKTVESVMSRVTTLLGTSCTTISNNGNGSGNPNTSNNNGGGSVSGDATVITPPPTVITTGSATTLPNGEISTVLVTLTSTFTPSTIVVNSSPNPSPTLGTQASQTSEDKVNLGPVIGGSLGGFFALLLIALAIWLFVIKRRRRWDDVFEKSSNDPDGAGSLGYSDTKASHSTTGRSKRRFSLGPDLEIEPKPYQYGIVGHSQNVSSQSKEAALITSRPSTAGSNYPLLGGHHATPSNASSQPYTPSYSPITAPTPAPSVPMSPPSRVPVQSTSNELEGYFGRRPGSPVSFTEAKGKLQVINGSPPSIYGGHSVRRKMSGSEHTPLIAAQRTIGLINANDDFVQTTGVDPRTKGRGEKGQKSSLPPPAAGTSGVLIPDDGPPKLILNL